MKKIIIFILLMNIFALPCLANQFIENERNTISIFKNTVNSVVNVSTLQSHNQNWLYGDNEVPAGAGSGFLWDKSGHIVTNYHVVKSGNKFKVSFHNDQNQYDAIIVGVEPKKDIAVLKLIKKPSQLLPIQIGSSTDLVVGQKAVAIGNPFGLDHTITSGIISALERKIEGVGGVKIHGMIQTDSSINPGNSGGPLLDSQGKLIGMNTVIFSGSGTSSGVGFAVPVDTIKRVAPQLIKYGKIIRPGLGIGVLPDHIKSRFGINKGIVISYIDQDGPLGKNGLKGMGQDQWGRYYIGDVITKINNTEVNTYDDIYQVLDKTKIGDQVVVEYIRNNRSLSTKVNLMELK